MGTPRGNPVGYSHYTPDCKSRWKVFPTYLDASVSPKVTRYFVWIRQVTFIPSLDLPSLAFRLKRPCPCSGLEARGSIPWYHGRSLSQKGL